MSDIILNYIIQAILGAASGYITNDYAINMLFKEYTPFKIGGVIKKTRNEFIDNISSLIENDIINKDKLNQILTDDAFKSKFEAITEDFFRYCLYESIGSDCISDIKGSDKSFDETGVFLNSFLDNHLKSLIDALLNRLQIESFLTEPQLNKIADSLFASVSDCIDSTDTIDELLLSLHKEKGSVKISDLLGASNNKVYDIAGNIIKKLNEIIKKDNKTEAAIVEIISDFDLVNSIVSIKKAYDEHTLRDVIKIDSALYQKLAQLFTDYINSERGQSTVFDMCESLFSYIKNIDKTLYEIADSSLEINLKEYLLENLPNFTESIVAWVILNSKNIDKIIEESIDEVINEADGVKGKLLSTIKNSYFSNLSDKYNIVQRIIDYIEKETEPERLSDKLSSTAIEYLDNYSVGSILMSIEDNNILTPAKATHYITDYINKNVDTVFQEIFNFIENRKIKDIIPDTVFENIFNRRLSQGIIDKIVSSDSINNALVDRLTIFIYDYLNKNINEAISKEALESKINSIRKLISESLSENSYKIKDYIKKEIKGASDNLKLNNYSAGISGYLKDEVNKKYNYFVSSYKNKRLTPAVDRLNKINNLSKNSSEFLRTLIINNLDRILGGSVKAIVYENLNKLNDDELCGFANDFIGRELQPIMYFGGILGAMAGILLAVFQNAPLNFGLITVENMVIYSFVGYLTNVIAINMIFKPYKEIRILRKIPFLKNFSLGYIVKNKKIFAESTADFVDNSLLSKDSINKIFEKYEDNIKTGFKSGIAADNYSSLHRLLNNNHDSTVDGLYSFLKNTAEKNSDSINDFVFKYIDNLPLLSPENISLISDFGAKNIKYATGKISDDLIGKIHSHIPLEEQFPIQVINYTKESINKITEKYYSLTCKNLGTSEYLNNFLMSFNERYVRYTEKTIEEMFERDKINEFSGFLSEKIAALALSDDLRAKAYNIFSELFNKSFDKNKTLGELFDGKIKEYISNKSPAVFDKIAEAIKVNIADSKGRVSISVQNEIKNNLGFIEKGMYNLLGGKEIVDDLIYKIMVVKVPQFIDSKKQELLYIFISSIVEEFYNIKAEKLQSSISKIQIKDIIDSYFSNSSNTDYIRSKIDATVTSLANKSADARLSDILKILSLENMSNIINSYGTIINQASGCFSESMTRNKTESLNKIEALTGCIVDEFIKSTSLYDLCNEISKEDISSVIENIVGELEKNEFLKISISNFLEVYQKHKGKVTISGFIDADEFNNAAKEYIHDIINNDETEKIIKELLSSAIKEASDCSFNFIQDDTKVYFVNIIVEAGVMAIRRNLDSMLKTIEFDKIAREEIEAMEPGRIHEMFDSFAGKYFSRLMLYGFGGFIFGINIYVGLSLTALKIINEKFFKEK